MRGLICALVLLICLPGLAAWADQVTLTNGDRLTGAILELDAVNLRFKTDMFGEVTIPRTAIASLSADQQLAVTLPDGRVTAATLTPAAGHVDVRADAETPTVSLQDIKALRTPENQAKYERRLHPRWFENWQVGLNSAFSAGRWRNHAEACVCYHRPSPWGSASGVGGRRGLSEKKEG